MQTHRVLVTGANGQLAHHIIHTFADHAVTALDRSQLDVTDPDAVRRAVSQAAPVGHRQLRRVQRRRRRRGSAARGAGRQRVRRAQPGARGRRTPARRSCTTAPTSCSTARASTPYEESDQPAPQSTYAASKLLGEWFALDAPRALRAAGREPVRVSRRLDRPPRDAGRASWTASGRAARCRCSPIASCRPATRPTSPRPPGICSIAGRPPGVYHCVNAGHATWEIVAIEIARQLGVEPQLKRLTIGPADAAGRPAALLRAGHAEAGGAGVHDAVVAGRARAAGSR